MEMEPVIVEEFGVHIDQHEVYRLLGKQGGSGSRERFEGVVGEAIEHAMGLLNPKGIYLVTSGCALPESVQFEDFEKVAFCVCTIGPGLEQEVSALSEKGNILKAVVLDSVGSVAAEATAEYMDQQIQELAAREGLLTSCRASPGYGDWNIEEQASIFRLLPAKRIGVRLTERYMMVPRKSVSFAVHIAKEPRRMRSENSCRNCDREDCPYRLTE